MSYILYKIDSLGKIREWNASVVASQNDSVIIVNTGISGGKMVTQLTNITDGKNIGRANETNPLEQANAELLSMYNKQIKRGYVSNIDEATQGKKGSGCPSPMLAKTYDPKKKQSGSNDLKGYKLEGETVVVQPKLDGVRRLFVLENNELKSYTRSGDSVPVMKHMILDICNFIADNGLEGKYLDGELYCDPYEMSFQELNGLTRKSDGDPERLKLIKYYLYDIISNHGYQARFICDRSWPRGESIEIIPSNMIEAEENIINYLHDHFIERGYEGIMIRTLNTPYENKRSKSLLKYKAFDDAEFLCTDIILDKEGMAGSITVVEGDLTFNPTMVGTDAFRLNLTKHPENIVGKMVTVNFFGRSIDGVPRFPRVKGIRYDL